MAWKVEGLKAEWLHFSLDVMRYEATARYCVCPVGVAYIGRHGTHGKKTGAELLYMFVIPQARRQGVGTFLHGKIAEDNDIIQTLGTTKSGTRFILSLGYEYCKTVHMYLWRRKGG